MKPKPKKRKPPIVSCGGLIDDYLVRTTKPEHKPKRKAAKMERVMCVQCAGFGKRYVFSLKQQVDCGQCNGWGYLWRKAVKR